jgi:hypothetical protein
MVHQHRWRGTVPPGRYHTVNSKEKIKKKGREKRIEERENRKKGDREKKKERK